MVTMDVQPWNIYLGLAIVGIFSGLGTAIGQYLFNNHLKTPTERIIILFKKFVKLFRKED